MAFHNALRADAARFIQRSWRKQVATHASNHAFALFSPLLPVLDVWAALLLATPKGMHAALRAVRYRYT